MPPATFVPIDLSGREFSSQNPPPAPVSIPRGNAILVSPIDPKHPSMRSVTDVAGRVQTFCKDKGIDPNLFAVVRAEQNNARCDLVRISSGESTTDHIRALWSDLEQSRETEVTWDAGSTRDRSRTTSIRIDPFVSAQDLPRPHLVKTVELLLKNDGIPLAHSWSKGNAAFLVLRYRADIDRLPALDYTLTVADEDDSDPFKSDVIQIVFHTDPSPVIFPRAPFEIVVSGWQPFTPSDVVLRMLLPILKKANLDPRTAGELLNLSMEDWNGGESLVARLLPSKWQFALSILEWRPVQSIAGAQRESDLSVPKLLVDLNFEATRRGPGSVTTLVSDEASNIRDSLENLSAGLNSVRKDVATTKNTVRDVQGQLLNVGQALHAHVAAGPQLAVLNDDHAETARDVRKLERKLKAGTITDDEKDDLEHARLELTRLASERDALNTAITQPLLALPAPSDSNTSYGPATASTDSASRKRKPAPGARGSGPRPAKLVVRRKEQSIQNTDEDHDMAEAATEAAEVHDELVPHT